MKLKDKVAIVTGGGQGIGEGIALKLAREGAHVAIADMNLDTATTVAEKIKTLGCKAVAVQTDVTNSASVNAMVQQVVNALGTIDILVNNAGYVAPMMRNFTKETEDYWNQVIAVCLNGVIYCSRAVVDTMMAKQSGKIHKYCLRCSPSWSAGTGCLFRRQRRRCGLLKGHRKGTGTLQHQRELHSSRCYQYTGISAGTGRDAGSSRENISTQKSCRG